MRKLSKGEKGIDYELISVKEKLANYTDHGINSRISQFVSSYVLTV